MIVFRKSKLLASLTCAVLFVSPVGLSPVAAAQKSELRYKELPSFHQANERLYRGAQPKAGGIARLAELGINTIINLRTDDERARVLRKKKRGRQGCDISRCR